MRLLNEEEDFLSGTKSASEFDSEALAYLGCCKGGDYSKA